MMNLTQLAQKLSDYINNVILPDKPNSSHLIETLRQNLKIFASILLFTFSLGMLISNGVSYVLIGSLLPKKPTISKSNLSFDNKPVSYSSIQQNIIARNIFNHTGEIPYEDTPEGSESFLIKNFDRAPCSASEKLPAPLQGIIYTGNPATNLVTLKDPNASIADVYTEGQPIIDHEEYSLYKVTGPVTAEFRHDKKKICISLNPPSYSSENSPKNLQGTEPISLDPVFVTDQLGPGFSKILNSARLVPQIIDGKTTGFKIFAIAKDSLFDKIELMNGDVIKTVNGINLEDPAQGFKIYEAFQDENNIDLQIQRNGESLNKKVTVQ